MHAVNHSRLIAYWLLVIVFKVVGQCVIGATTRLTESGLSIVEWNPVRGAIPPLTASDWQDEFSAYKTSPQYQKVNHGMSLVEFKYIFWWEWAHRFWARLIGVMFAVPLFFFWVKNWIPQGYKPRLFGLFVLGCLQGVMGWVMVASGLVDNPAVSHYRLAAHLLLALLVMSLAWRWALSLLGHKMDIPDGLHKHGLATLVILLCTIIYGAFVAGLDAGLIYNEFPKMGKTLVPSEFWAMSPWWQNLFENHASVQFIHRYLGIITGLMVLAFGVRGLKRHPHNKFFMGCIFMALMQPALGVGTLLYQVPVLLAVMHQFGAVILLLLLQGALHGGTRARDNRPVLSA